MEKKIKRRNFNVACDYFCICFEFPTTMKKLKELVKEVKSFLKGESLKYRSISLEKELSKELSIPEESLKELYKHLKKSFIGVETDFLDLGIFYELEVRSIPNFRTLMASLEEKLEKLEKENRFKLEEKIEKLREQFGRLDLIKKGDQFGVFVRITSFSEEKRKIDGKVNKRVIRFRKILEKYVTTLERCNACGRFIFNMKDFKFAGGFILPRDLQLQVDRESRLGIAKLTGVFLTFEGSPLGIDTVHIETRDKEGMILIGTRYKISNLDSLNEKAYEYLRGIAKLFVEEV